MPPPVPPGLPQDLPHRAPPPYMSAASYACVSGANERINLGLIGRAARRGRAHGRVQQTTMGRERAVRGRLLIRKVSRARRACEGVVRIDAKQFVHYEEFRAGRWTPISSATTSTPYTSRRRRRRQGYLL